MKDFVWNNCTKIIFGKGAADQIGEAAKPFGSKALLVYGTSSIKKTGLYDRVASHLRETGIGFIDFGGAKSNPVLSHARRGIEIARAENIDFIIAVGGGSAIDTAKTIAVGVPADQDVWDFFTYKASPDRALPVITLVTLPASGSEMNENVVITDDETREKMAFPCPVVCPRVSVLDPTVTFTVSGAYTAYAAADIFSHVLDAYFTRQIDWSPLQDSIAEGIIRATIQSVDRIMKNPEDYDARATMMWAAPWALNGLVQAGLGYVGAPLHLLEHPVSGIFDVAHGAGMSVLIPAWLEITAGAQAGRCAQLARNVFGITEKDDAKAAREGASRFKNWFESVGAPTSLAAAGIKVDQIEELTDRAFRQFDKIGLGIPREFFSEVYQLAR